MQRPRVLVLGINYAPEPTGIAPYTTGLVAGLGSRGFDVRVITTLPHYPEWRVTPGWDARVGAREEDGIAVRRVRHYVPSEPTGVHRAASEVSFGIRSVMTGWERPDLVLCTSPALLGTAMALARASAGSLRPATGMVVQDLYSTGAGQIGGYGAFVGAALARLEQWALGRADGVAVIHPRLKARIIADLEVADQKIVVIRNWTHIGSESLSDRAQVRARLGWLPEEFIVMHTGAMGEKQDLLNVVKAARLADNAAASIRFVLVGDGGQRASLVSAGATVSRLDFLAPVEEPEYVALLSAADLLLVNERPGVIETAVPSKLTSYFSSGVPILAATEPFSTTAEEVLSSAAGVITPPGDPRGLLSMIQMLAADQEQRSRLGANGPLYCADVLSEGVALDAYADWASRLIAQRD